MAATDPRIQLVKDNILVYPDFPKAGIDFKDIFGAMRKTEVLRVLLDLVKEFAQGLKGHIDCVVGLDSRGFLFGPLMAVELAVPFVPIRKKGKLPGQCTGVSYDLEYGSASVELQSNAFEFCQKGSSSSKARILVVDDLMATGGTMKAACDVLNAHVEAEVTHAFVVMELAFLQGKSQLPSSVNYHSLISYE